MSIFTPDETTVSIGHVHFYDIMRFEHNNKLRSNETQTVKY